MTEPTKPEPISEARLAGLVSVTKRMVCLDNFVISGDEACNIVRELKALRQENEWRPISDCPDGETVLFLWPTGRVEVGGMQHAQLRMGGHRQDSFWGGPFANTADDNPPTHYRPLPAPPAPRTEEK